MFCIKCGKALPDEAAFCFACGAKVYKDDDKTVSYSMSVPSEDSFLYTYSDRQEALDFIETYVKDSGDARSICNFFYYQRVICHPSGKLYGFIYSHKPEFQNEKNYYYNLYEYDLKDRSYRFLGGGSRGGIETLYIYNNIAYWEDFGICRLDMDTGEFIESKEQWVKDEYNDILNKPKF